MPVPVPVPRESISNSFVRAGAVLPAADRAVRDADSTCIFTGGSLDTAAGRHESLATCQGSACPPNVRSQPQTSSLRPQASSLKLQASAQSVRYEDLISERLSLQTERLIAFCHPFHVLLCSYSPRRCFLDNFTTIERMPRDSRTKPCKGIGTCCYR